MKKKLIFLIGLLTCSISIAADDKEEVYVTYQGLRFHRTYVSTNFGAMLEVRFSLCLPESGEYSGDITIPQTIPYHLEAQYVDGRWLDADPILLTCESAKVYDAEFSFKGNENITSVTYPKSFTVSSFKGCTNLKKIVLPIGPFQLYNNYYMPEQMFMGCKNLTEVSHAAHLKYLRKSTFEGCEKLKKIDLTETYETEFGDIEVKSISSIEDSAFKDCKSLESIDLSNVTSIGSYAFQGCSKLKEVIFEKGIILNSEGIFSDCINLKTVSGFENILNSAAL